MAATYNNSMDVRVKQRLCYHVASLPLACVAARPKSSQALGASPLVKVISI